MGQIKVIDVSRWNGDIKWDKVYAAGVRGTIVRVACNGQEDQMFSTNFTEAKRNGIQVGVYYVPFVKSIDLMGEKKSAKENARFCINLLCGLKLDLPVYLDWEYTQDEQVNVDTEKRTIFAKCFCDEIKNSGYRPGIYTNPDYIRYKLEWKKLKKNNLFLALHKQSDWELRDCYDRMKLGAVIWQFGAGKLDGVSTDVDKGWMYI